MDIFGDIYGAYETAADEGAQSLIDEGIDEKWAEAIANVAERNITPPEVHISGYIDIQTFDPDGVDIVIKALKAAEDNNTEDEVKVQYVGAPRYRITVTSSDYRIAEKELQNAADRAIKIIEDSNGNGEFLRELEDN